MASNLLGNYNPNAGRVNLLYGGGDTSGGMTELQCLRQGGRWDPITQTCMLGEKEGQDAISPEETGVMDLPGQALQVFNPDIDYTDAFVASNGQLVGILPDGTASASDFQIGSSQQPTDFATPYALPDGSSAIQMNDAGAAISTGYDVGQVDPRLAQGAGYSPAEKARALQQGQYGVALELGATPEEIEAAGGPSVPVLAAAIANVIGNTTVAQVIEQITGKSLSDSIRNSALRGSILNNIRSDFESRPVVAATSDSGPSQEAVNNYADNLAESTRISRSDDNDGPSHAEIIADSRARAAAQVARDNQETSRTDSSGRETWSSKVARGGGFNAGGMVPMYANDGTLLNHPFEREGEQFDTVDAKLTPGEFVIDADSTHVFKNLLEKVNEWEPGDDISLGGLLSKKGEKMTITKDLGNGRKMSVTSGEDDEMMMSDAANMLSTDTEAATLLSSTPKEEPQYLNVGGLLNGGFSARRNARNARNAQRSGALLNSGIQSLGRNLDNRVAQAGAAGLRTNSLGSWGPGGYRGANFSSRNAPATNFGSQLQAIGQGAQEVGNIEGTYQDELTRIGERGQNIMLQEQRRAEDRANQLADRDALWNREDKLRAEDAAAKALKDAPKETQEETIRLANQAGKLLQDASIAGDIINGHKLIPQVEQGIKAKITSIGTAVVNTVGGAFDQTSRIREEARYRYANEQYPSSVSAYVRLKGIAERMVFPILATGALGVNPTDADVDLARSSTFDITAPSTAWADQLNYVIESAGGTGNIPSVKPSGMGASDPGGDDRSAGGRDLDSDLGIGQSDNQQTLLDLKGQETIDKAKIGIDALKDKNAGRIQSWRDKVRDIGG